jgi:hypothetical protein
MGLDGPSSHLQLPGDFIVVAALQEQLDDLLLPMPQTDGFFAH